MGAGFVKGRLTHGILASLLFVASAYSQAAHSDYVLTTAAQGLEGPFAMALLPEGEILVTEKRGRVLAVRGDGGRPVPVEGLPPVLHLGDYDGLQDIVPHPRFSENRRIYVSFVHGERDANAVRVISARYVEGRLSDVRTVFTAAPLKATLNHPGARLAFVNDGSLLITIGDGYEYREQAQNLSSHLGKVIRVTDAGQIPADNPFKDASGRPTAVWSYGHRHPQGLLYDAVTDRLYEHEHGPRGGDELNVIEKGANYGWPIATFGISYSGAYVSPYTSYPGTKQPLLRWTPSLAPCGFAQCRGCQWREWEGDLFIGMLAGRQVRRVSLRSSGPAAQEPLFEELDARVRDVRFGPDGALYLLLDDGRLLKASATRS
jgi:glucose/arabinose dehydrogenase